MSADARDSSSELPPPLPRDSCTHGSSSVRVALVDSAFEGEPGDIGVLLYKIEVSNAGRRDTIRGNRTTTMPGVNGDGKVHFFAYQSTSNIVDGAAIYDPATRNVNLFRAPQPIEYDGQHPSISPDACHVAYIDSEDTTKTSFGLIATWPNAKVILRTPKEPYVHDEVDYNALRWIDSNRVEFAYRSGRAKNLWIHATVTIDTRSIKVDSLSAYPIWNP